MKSLTDGIKKLDTLLVIHQDVPLGYIKAQLAKSASVMILSTHRFFENEINELKISTCSEIIFRTFQDFLSDIEMEEADIAALNELKKNTHSTISVVDFMEKSVFQKNVFILRKIQTLYSFHRILCADGLGISQKAWLQYQAAECIIEKGNAACEKKQKFLVRSLSKIIDCLRRFKRNFSTIESDIIEYKGRKYWFPLGLGRLKINQDLPIQKLRIRLTDIENGNINKREIRDHYLKKKKVQEKDLLICSTLHRYYSSADFFFQDGYLPSNYTPQAYQHMAGKQFVYHAFFLRQWLLDVGLVPIYLPDFFLNQKLISITKERNQQKRPSVILVALNHAGDWSALINRSDTDNLIIAVTKLAQLIPDVKFSIRPHPTMTHPQHEGVHSRERIIHHVKMTKLQNLTVSSNSLAEDLSVADLVLGEYTSVLISAYQLGIPALIVNLTRRRSFMEDFQKIGFSFVSSEEELNTFFFRLSLSYHELINQNNAAVVRYNQLYDYSLSSDKNQQRS